ncbi:unnamed protein product [Psylliodes chrysocephalus]|uniref:Uncharacterized protein n=1 Tax=Psylliodes chrysocephalus TaxID=3402493 RepID=A0A9P0D2S3_9CUCU|nr:unnamed protein product [Psylliodes chrysocephala]
MHEIEEQFTNNTVCSVAISIRRTLNDPIFNLLLTFFHHVMPHVDILFNQLQQRKIEPILVKDVIDNFESSITQVRNNIDSIITEASDIISEQPPENKRKRPGNSRFNHRISAVEVCDVILNCAKDRFDFKEHLIVSSLFFFECFGEYCGKLPENKLTSACWFYPTIDKELLRTELSVIYSRNGCRTLNGALPLLKFLISNNLEDTLKETRK